MKGRKTIITNPLETHLDSISRYHLYVFFVIFLSKIPVFWHILNLIFLSPPMTFYCAPKIVNGVVVKSEETKDLCPCEDPWWDRSVFEETMQTKFDVYCDTSWMVSFSQSVFHSGSLVGCLIFGFLSDSFGRLNMFSLSCLLLAVSGCLVSVMPTAVAFTCMRFFEGVSVGGTIVTSYVLCVEYCGVTHRELITALFHIPLNIGHMTLPGVSYFLRNFDEFQLTISLPLFLFAASKFIMKESPKWLMENGCIDEVVSVIGRIDSSQSANVIYADIEKYIDAQKQKNIAKVQLWHIFRHRDVFKNFGVMCVVYFVCGMGYYGVSQFIGEMSGNIHLNVAISGTLLIPGTVTAVFLLRILNRRTFLIGTEFLSGIIMVMVICIPHRWNMMKVFFACAGNCFFFMSFIIAYLYGAELFPTPIRNSVIGVLAVLSRVGQILVPPINHVSNTAAGVIYGVLALFCSFLCLLLPETKNISLPSTLNDAHLTRVDKKQEASVEDNAGPSKAV